MVWLFFLPLLAFLLLAVGAWLGIHGLTLDRTIRVSDFPTLLATTLIALVLQYVLQKRGKATESEKELLTDQVSEALGAFAEARQVIARTVGQQLSPSDAIAITQTLEECSECISSLEFCITQSHCHKLAPECREIGNAFIFYKRSITGGNFPASPISATDLAQSFLYRSQIDRKLRLLSLNVGKV